MATNSGQPHLGIVSTVKPAYKGHSREPFIAGIAKATHHAQLALPSRLWRIEVRYLCAHVRPVNSRHYRQLFVI